MASFVKIRLNQNLIISTDVYLKCQDWAFPVIQDICKKIVIVMNNEAHTILKSSTNLLQCSTTGG